MKIMFPISGIIDWWRLRKFRHQENRRMEIHRELRILNQQADRMIKEAEQANGKISK